MLHECRKRLQHSFNMHVALRMLLSIRCMLHACYMRTFLHRVGRRVVLSVTVLDISAFIFSTLNASSNCEPPAAKAECCVCAHTVIIRMQ